MTSWATSDAWGRPWEMAESLLWWVKNRPLCNGNNLSLPYHIWQNSLPANMGKFVFSQNKTWRNYKFAWNSWPAISQHHLCSTSSSDAHVICQISTDLFPALFHHKDLTPRDMFRTVMTCWWLNPLASLWGQLYYKVEAHGIPHPPFWVLAFLCWLAMLH